MHRLRGSIKIASLYWVTAVDATQCHRLTTSEIWAVLKIIKQSMFEIRRTNASALAKDHYQLTSISNLIYAFYRESHRSKTLLAAV